MFKIYIGNLDKRTTAEQLKMLFTGFDDLDDLVVATDDVGASRGFAIAMFRDPTRGQLAIETLRNRRMNGRSLIVNEVLKKGQKLPPREDAGPLGPRSGGGRSGGSSSGGSRGGDGGGYRAGSSSGGSRGGDGGGYRAGFRSASGSSAGADGSGGRNPRRASGFTSRPAEGGGGAGAPGDSTNRPEGGSLRPMRPLSSGGFRPSVQRPPSAKPGDGTSGVGDSSTAGPDSAPTP
ncbi:MAG: RNA-binding protein [Phycisphaerales bacterium]|nr:RNA-binding protein [Phycisphaerales bacterium]